MLLLGISSINDVLEALMRSLGLRGQLRVMRAVRLRKHAERLTYDS